MRGILLTTRGPGAGVGSSPGVPVALPQALCTRCPLLHWTSRGSLYTVTVIARLPAYLLRVGHLARCWGHAEPQTVWGTGDMYSSGNEPWEGRPPEEKPAGLGMECEKVTEGGCGLYWMLVLLESCSGGFPQPGSPNPASMSATLSPPRPLLSVSH